MCRATEHRVTHSHARAGLYIRPREIAREWGDACWDDVRVENTRDLPGAWRLHLTSGFFMKHSDVHLAVRLVHFVFPSSSVAYMSEPILPTFPVPAFGRDLM